MAQPDKQLPDLVISAQEIAEATAPFIVAYGGQVYRLRNPNSLSIDDMMTVDKTAEASMLDALVYVADDDTKTWLSGMPNVFLRQVFDAWSAMLQVPPGEDDGSVESSEPQTSE